MNKMFLYTVWILSGICSVVPELHARTKGDPEVNKPDKRILMLGLNDNVKSNYFYLELITEETGINEDSIALEYNAVVIENLENVSKEGYVFVPATSGEAEIKWINGIFASGEGEECYSDLSSVSSDKLSQTLNTAGASYLLVLNQHYLKWQETPLRTLFHIISYTLFDKDKNEIYRGNHYFTSMNLERPDKLRIISRKACSHIASVIINKIK